MTRTFPVCRAVAAVATIAAFTVPSSVPAQGAAGTDIHLIPLSINSAGVVLGTPVNITSRPGYDNQPSFGPDGRSLLFTSIRADAQSDIYSYELASRATVRVTSTPESEYSATVMPGGLRMSVIRVEADSTQRLWSFRRDGTDPRVVLANVKPVGYHAWANDSILALFVLGSPATLQVANARTGVARTLLGGIGRSIHRIPGTAMISFVHKQSDSVWVIRKLDPATDSIVTLVQTLPRVEDYAWAPDGTILMAQGNRILAWKAFPGSTGAATEWKEVAAYPDPPVDPGAPALTPPGAMRRLSRIAVSPRGDWIAVVAAEPPR